MHAIHERLLSTGVLFTIKYILIAIMRRGKPVSRNFFNHPGYLKLDVTCYNTSVVNNYSPIHHGIYENQMFLYSHIGSMTNLERNRYSKTRLVKVYENDIAKLNFYDYNGKRKHKKSHHETEGDIEIRLRLDYWIQTKYRNMHILIMPNKIRI